MSQSHARLFEKWVNAGDDRTFEEWLFYQRACRMAMQAQQGLAWGVWSLPFHTWHWSTAPAWTLETDVPWRIGAPFDEAVRR